MSKQEQNKFNCRQNWSEESEEKINEQINIELLASHQYLFLSTYFGRDDVALEPLSKYFYKASLEEREHARKLIDYQNMRGGIVKLGPIACPNTEFKTKNKVYEAFEFSLLLEKTVNSSLLNLHKIADSNNDPQFGDFLEGEFLIEQNEANSELSRYLTQLEMIGDNGYGIWEFVNKLSH